MTRALVTQMLEAMEPVSAYGLPGTKDVQQAKLQEAVTAAREYLATDSDLTLTEALAQQGIKLRTEFEPKQRDSELAAEPRGERAELIARLAKQWAELDPVDPYRADIGKAADMLEADAQPKQVTCQIYGHVVGACVECNTHIEAQQAKRVPPGDLYALALKADNGGQP